MSLMFLAFLSVHFFIRKLSMLEVFTLVYLLPESKGSLSSFLSTGRGVAV